MAEVDLERTASRVILIAPNSAALLVHGHDPADPGRGGFYWTPGGGLRAGETHVAAARRELYEEVGRRDFAIGPVVLTQVVEFPFGGRQVRQYEQFLLVRADSPFEARSTALTELETQAIDELVWLTPGEMRAVADAVYPRCLPDLIEYCFEHGAPNPPWEGAG